jgi:TonB family protein
MKKIIILLAGLLLASSLKSQIFYDEHFHKLLNETGASYYRLSDTINNEIIETTYWINDSIYEITHYTTSSYRLRHGKNYQYYKSGKLKYDIDFSNNKINGTLKGYFENGNIRRIDNYKNDSLIEGKCYTKDGLDTAYYVYLKNASYKGQNLEGFRRFVSSKLKYPRLAIENNIQGKVLIEFDVNSKGEIVDIFIVESPDDLLSQAAIKALNQSDLWEPCIGEGKKARQKFTMPLYFSLQ